jgi:N-formylglutamate amidohydrolase
METKDYPGPEHRIMDNQNFYARRIGRGRSRNMAPSHDFVRTSEEDLELLVNDADWWTVSRGFSPIVGTAIHNGHNVRSDVQALMALPRNDRLREEDPFTEFIIRDLSNRIVCHRSRFEVDLNRPREAAVYLSPEQAWNETLEGKSRIVDGGAITHRSRCLLRNAKAGFV